MRSLATIIVFLVVFLLEVFFGVGLGWSVFWSLLIAFFFYAGTDGYNNAKKSNTNNSDDEFPLSYFGTNPREGTEAYRIQGEVEKCINIAHQKGAPELISKLYFRDIKYYPSWIAHEGRECVPKIITNATKSRKKSNENKKEKEVTSIVLNEKNYSFEFHQSTFVTPDGENNTNGLLELFREETKILALNCSLEYTDMDSEWSEFGVEAFIDGDWLKDFELLKKEINKQRYEKELQKAEDPEKVKQLKNNFGIK
ncbi:MAG: hypothetical protein Q7S57_01170 [bacterium]|nr:hypothetical protein [bacterium]